MNYTQEFKQKILSKYGWSARFDTDDQGKWFVEVTLRFHDTRRFGTSETCPADTVKGRKQGIRAASQAAVEGLQQEVERMESLPSKTLSEAFPEEIQVYESTKKNWDWFWRHKPKVVGIDAEGNQTSPPVLVQISVQDYTILEAPRKSISQNLSRLMKDESIIKVFCDNGSHHDKKCVGVPVSSESDFSKGHIVDLEVLMNLFLGHADQCRGLSKILTICMPEADFLIRKPTSKKGKMSNIGRFALIEQGKKPPLRGIQDLSNKEKQYSALDSWATLQAYTYLLDRLPANVSTKPVVAGELIQQP